jgi:hypothetical protein
VVRDANGRTLSTITGPIANSYSTSYFVPAVTNHFYLVADSILIFRQGAPNVLTFLMERDGSLKVALANQNVRVSPRNEHRIYCFSSKTTIKRLTMAKQMAYDAHLRVKNSKSQIV